MPKSKEQFDAMKTATVEKINDAGLKMFVRKGLTGTSIKEIATEAGISMGLMYHYYKSKEELYAELVKIAVTGANESIQRLAESDMSPEEQIETFTAQMLHSLETYAETPYFFLLMTQTMLNQHSLQLPEKRVEEAYASLFVLRSIIERGQAAGVVRSGNSTSLSLTYMSAFVGLCSYKLMCGELFSLPEPEWINEILIIKNK
jgi:AcrR family transcriptional regulator